MVGIYRIRNLINNKCYYGSSKNIKKRWNYHKNNLNKKTHINTILQKAWNKYGDNNFIFEVVEECDEILLKEIEQKYLNLNPEYNIGKTSSGGDNITKNPNRKIIVENIKNSLVVRYNNMTDEQRKEKFSRPMEQNPNWKGGTSYVYCKCGKKIGYNNKHCNKCRPRSDKNNPFYSKKHSEKTKKFLSENMKGKKPINMKSVRIDNTTYESLAEASRQTGIPSPTILWRINSKNKKYENYNYI